MVLCYCSDSCWVCNSVYRQKDVDAINPTEIAAGNDPVELRKQYPRLGIFGGIDKSVLSKNKTAVYEEVMSKVPFNVGRPISCAVAEQPRRR